MLSRLLVRLLSNNEHLIQRLSESYPIRRAAQWVVLYFYKSKGIIEDKAITRRLTPEQFRSFIQRFAENLREEMKQAQDKFQKPK